MSLPEVNPESLALEIEAARAAGGRLTPLTSRFPGFSLDDGYRVAGVLACRRAARSPIVGRKIGFTNTELWKAARLDQPVWGWMYEESVTRAAPGAGPPTISMEGAVEPKIELEVVVVLGEEVPPGERGAAVARRVAQVGLGFEVVDPPYPGWKMRPADTVAAGGLHQGLAVGPLVEAGNPEELEELLRELEVRVDRAPARDPRAAARVCTGTGRLVLGNPLDAVGFLAEITARQGNPLRAGEIITTGTLTPPLPAAAGEFYRGEAAGGVLPAAEAVLV